MPSSNSVLIQDIVLLTEKHQTGKYMIILNLVKTMHSANSVLIQDIVHLEKPHTDKNKFNIESCCQNCTQYQLRTDSKHCASYRKKSY